MSDYLSNMMMFYTYTIYNTLKQNIRREQLIFNYILLWFVWHVLIIFIISSFFPFYYIIVNFCFDSLSFRGTKVNVNITNIYSIIPF